ncbi:MAG TPA: VOC family protein [Nocardioidaceae bacterium]|nr:VOC family protein [Nocardioidaceae bacterium]
MTARARWKELCVDTDGDDTLGRFYAVALGLDFEPDEDGAGGLTGDVEGKGIAMCKVPEAKTVKHRVHIDVVAESIDDLVAKGASVVLPAEESGMPWTVMTDPEGGEFCAFLRDHAPDYRFFQLIVDSVNAHEIARWWADVFDATPLSHFSDDWWAVEDIPGLPFTALTFGSVPEPKTVKNRIHWDVYGNVADMQAAGATVLRERDEDASAGSGQRIGWTVMADPEGNEFCVFEK